MIESKRKKGETFEAFLRRFNKRVMHSGVLLQFKKVRFYEKTKNRNLRRDSALHKKKKRELMDYLKKIGRLPEEEIRGSRKY